MFIFASLTPGLSADRRLSTLLYYNGDVKISDLRLGEERYLYRDSNTWHITRSDGDQVIVFSNGQEERRHQDGSLTVTFPDGTVKTVEVGGEEKVQFTDGTLITLRTNGEKHVRQSESVQIKDSNTFFRISS